MSNIHSISLFQENNNPVIREINYNRMISKINEFIIKKIGSENFVPTETFELKYLYDKLTKCTEKDHELFFFLGRCIEEITYKISLKNNSCVISGTSLTDKELDELINSIYTI